MIFVEGKADVLLATNIVESGLDIPRANTIVVCVPRWADMRVFGMTPGLDDTPLRRRPSHPSIIS